MSQHDTNKDNHLADFANQTLQGKINQHASSSDEDMVRLEETILRLKNTLPSNAPDAAISKQMLVRLKARIKREEEAQKQPFWKKLFDFQANPQVGMILTIATVLIFAIITIPSLQLSGDAVTGTANATTNILIGSGVVGILLLIYWFSRRK